MAKDKEIISLTFDEKVIKELEKEKNKSKFVNDLLLDYFFKKKETDKNDLKIISDFIQEMKTLNFKADKLYELLSINVNCSAVAMQTAKIIKPDFIIKEKLDIIAEQVTKELNKLKEFKEINK